MAYQEKIMFEIYRDDSYSREFRVVYYSELNEHNKDVEIDRAMLGDHVFDGYFLALKKDKVMRSITELIHQLNQAEHPDPSVIGAELAEYLLK
ncbi:MAG: hypothetical protein HQ556_00080 [Candidatus Marinimicrobia bacterium]|nr:hypothetical protein [Candidatus Neomarinimicrobiota bacterium]